MTIIQDLNAIGVPIPTPILQAEAMRHAVTTALSDTPELSAFLERVRAREIKPDQVAKELQALGQTLAGRHALQGPISADISAALDIAGRAAVTASETELYDTMRPLVETAGAKLAAAIAVVGIEPDEKLLRQLGAAAGGALDSFDASVKLLRGVKEIVQQLSGQIVTLTMQRFVDLPPATWVELPQLKTTEDLERLNRCHRFPAMVDAGFALSLNTQAEVTAKLQAIAAARPPVKVISDEPDEFGDRTADAWLTGKVGPRG